MELLQINKLGTQPTCAQEIPALLDQNGIQWNPIAENNWAESSPISRRSAFAWHTRDSTCCCTTRLRKLVSEPLPRKTMTRCTRTPAVNSFSNNKKVPAITTLSVIVPGPFFWVFGIILCQRNMRLQKYSNSLTDGARSDGRSASYRRETSIGNWHCSFPLPPFSRAISAVSTASTRAAISTNAVINCRDRTTFHGNPSEPTSPTSTCHNSSGNAGSKSIVCKTSLFYFRAFTPRCVGTTGRMVPSALNSMRSMQTSRWKPGP